MVVGDEGLSDTDVASLSRAITAGRPPSPLRLTAGSGSPRASALRLLVLVLLLGEDMVALGFNKNETSRVEESSQSSQSTDNVN